MAELSLAHMGAPGEKAAQLPEVQVMVGGKEAPELPVTWEVVLVILHVIALQTEALAFQKIGIVSLELADLRHRPNSFREQRTSGGLGQRCLLEKRGR